MTWYRYTEPTEKQRLYNELLESIFNVKNEYGEWVPYKMTEYQKEYHANSLNILGTEALDILLIKGRGTSFTTSTLIDYIMTGHMNSDLILPVISQREKTAINHVKKAKALIKNCNSDELKNAVTLYNSEIKWDNGSVMSPYPSSSAADSIRGERLLRVFVDEYAFQQSDEELLAATQETMRGELGQLLIGSTPCGMHNQFFKLVNAQRKGEDKGFKLLEWPIFETNKYNNNILPSEQNLEPIAPWISIKTLDKEWKRDKNIFAQENMNDFLDDHLALISYKTIEQVSYDNINYKNKLQKDSNFIYLTENPIQFGWDFAETVDLAAVSGFEIMTDENGNTFYKQIFLDYFKGMETPEQREYIGRIIRAFPTISKIRIDSTGPGTGLYTESRRAYGSIIDGIKFSKSLKAGDITMRIREYMITRLKSMLEDKRIALIKDPIQTSHMTSMNYAYKIERNSDGHGDILFSNALGILPINYKTAGGETQKIINNTRSSSSNGNNRPNKQNTRETIENKINRYKRVRM